MTIGSEFIENKWFIHYLYFDEKLLLDVSTDMSKFMRPMLNVRRSSKSSDKDVIDRVTLLRNQHLERLIKKLKLEKKVGHPENSSDVGGLAIVSKSITFLDDVDAEFAKCKINDKEYLVRKDSFENQEVSEFNVTKDDDFLIVGLNKKIIAIIMLGKCFPLKGKFAFKTATDKMIEKSKKVLKS